MFRWKKNIKYKIKDRIKTQQTEYVWHTMHVLNKGKREMAHRASAIDTMCSAERHLKKVGRMTSGALWPAARGGTFQQRAWKSSALSLKQLMAPAPALQENCGGGGGTTN